MSEKRGYLNLAAIVASLPLAMLALWAFGMNWAAPISSIPVVAFAYYLGRTERAQ